MEVVIKSTIVGAIIGSPNIIKVKVDKVLVDSIRFKVIRSFRGDLRPTTSITVAKRFFAGVIHFPVTVTSRKEEAELVDSLRVPQRYLEENYQLAENCIDTFIIIGVRKAFSGYDVGHIYALLGKKAYANTPSDREYGMPYSSVENLDDSEMIQQIITVTVNHIESRESSRNEAGTDYKLYIDEFLDKYKPNTSVNSSLRLNGLGDLLMFDLNKTFKSLSVDEKIELSVYSEKIIEEEFPYDKLNYLNRIWGMEISSSKDLESVVKIFPRLLPNTRTFYQVKMLIIYSLLEDRKYEVRKKTIRKFLRSMSGNWNEDDDFNRRKLVLMLTD